jgi:hypothetical protein
MRETQKVADLVVMPPEVGTHRQFIFPRYREKSGHFLE